MKTDARPVRGVERVPCKRGRAAPRAGFTIIELLAVAGIIVLLLGIVAAVVSRTIYSSERTLAENQLRVGVAAARDAAIRSEGGDGAAVFVYRDGRTLILPCVSVGTLVDDEVLGPDGTPRDLRVSREVFVPIVTQQSLSLPRGWSVRGFAPGGSLDGERTPSGWYAWMGADNATDVLDGHWVFPETEFLDATQAEQGWRRNAFMIRFEAQTGELVVSSDDTVLVVDPVTADEFRNADPYKENRIDKASDLASWVRRQLARSQLHLNAATDTTDLHRLLGARSNDTILARPLTRVCLYDEQRLARGVGIARANALTQTLYLPEPEASTQFATSPWDPAAVPAGVTNPIELQRRMNQWLVQDPESGTVPVDITGPFEARVFTLSRYLGQLQEVTP
jgi:hypothetical protein